MKKLSIIIFLLTTLISNLYFFYVINNVGWGISILSNFKRLIMEAIFMYDITMVPSIFCVCYVYVLRKVL